MSAAGHGAAAGAGLGIALVFLGQQLGYLSLSDLWPAIEYVVIGGVAGAILFGLVGWGLGRLHRRRQAKTPVASS